MNRKKRVAIFARASSDKQAISGETLNTQIDELLYIIKKEDWDLAKLKTFVESGRKEDRNVFDSFIDFCIDPKNKMDILLIKGIDRFCRQGSDSYLEIKGRLKKAGVMLIDAEGVIQGEKNTLESLNFVYGWSTHEPSRLNEITKAEQAKDEVRISLTRMISHEIRYTQQGYWSRNSVYGYQNQKIDTEDHGRRNILVEQPDEAFFIKKMFELKALRNYTDQAIVIEINKLGFKTRTLTRRDKLTKKAIGKIGDKCLTVKQLQRYLKRVTYAGIIMEKWTHNKPVLAKFEGLVSIDLFNKANEGRIFIKMKGDQVEIKKKYSSWAVKRNKQNPLYPYKNVVLCPECRKPLLGSASTGKSGKKFPSYHCSRDHRRFSARPGEVNTLVEDTISKLQFSEKDGRLFKECFMLVYGQRKSEAVKDSVKYSQTLDDLKIRQESAYETIKTTLIPLIRHRAEREYEELEDQILFLGDLTIKKEKKELGARKAYKQASYLMEHLGEVLIDRDNVCNQESLFRLAFKELPTYKDLENGTLNLHPLFNLKQASISSKSQMVSPNTLVWNSYLIV